VCPSPPLSLCPPEMSNPRKMASPLDHNPQCLNYWSKDPHDRVFGTIYNAVSSKWFPSAILFMTIKPCTMPKTCYLSAVANSAETATFKLLPYSGGRLNTPPYSKLLKAYPHLCFTLGTIPSSDLSYANPSFWVNKMILLPATVGICT